MPIEGLRPLTRFTLTDEECLEVAAASKPRVLLLNDQRTPQDMANEVWQRLALKYGFLVSTVVPDPETKDRGTFLAVSTKEEPNGGSQE